MLGIHGPNAKLHIGADMRRSIQVRQAVDQDLVSGDTKDLQVANIFNLEFIQDCLRKGHHRLAYRDLPQFYFTWRTRTQSVAPDEFFPGVSKRLEPAFGNGFSGTSTKPPDAGSNHRPRAAPLSAVMSREPGESSAFCQGPWPKAYPDHQFSVANSQMSRWPKKPPAVAPPKMAQYSCSRTDAGSPGIHFSFSYPVSFRYAGRGGESL